jgi:hypothetical protein
MLEQNYKCYEKNFQPHLDFHLIFYFREKNLNFNVKNYTKLELNFY